MLPSYVVSEKLAKFALLPFICTSNVNNLQTVANEKQIGQKFRFFKVTARIIRWSWFHSPLGAIFDDFFFFALPCEKICQIIWQKCLIVKNSNFKLVFNLVFHDCISVRLSERFLQKEEQKKNHQTLFPVGIEPITFWSSCQCSTN